jgi:integrase
MEKTRLKTWEDIERLPAPDPSGKQVIHWDMDQLGFGVMCSGLTGAKSFVVQKNVGGHTKRFTLGPVEEYLAKSRKAKVDLGEAKAVLSAAEAEGDSIKMDWAKQAIIKANTFLDPIQVARDDGARITEDLRKGRDPRTKVKITTLAEALADYVENKNSVGERTKQFYQAMINKNFKDWLGTPLSAISPENISERIREIKEGVEKARKEKAAELGEKATKTFINDEGAGAGAVTANICFRTLRAIWKRAALHNPDIPEWNAEMLRDVQFKLLPRETVLETDQFKPFVEAVNAKNSRGEYLIGEDQRDFFLLSLFTGLRFGDVVGLCWSQVDLMGGKLKRSRVQTKGQRTKLELPLSDFVYDLLATRKASRLDPNNDFVFPGDAKSGHMECPKRAIDRIQKMTGLTVNPHKLRHSFISVMEQCGIQFLKRKALVGHIGGKDTTADYSHFGIEDLREPAQMIADKIREHAGIPKPKANLKLA